MTVYKEFFLIIDWNEFFFYITLPPLPVVNNPIRSKRTWPNMVNFTVSPAGDWQTGNIWWEVAQSRFFVDLKSNFALKNSFMEFLPGPITRQINVMCESQMKWTWHHSKLAVEEASFFGRLRVGLLQQLIYTRWGSRRYGLGCHAPMMVTQPLIDALSRIFQKQISFIRTLFNRRCYSDCWLDNWKITHIVLLLIIERNWSAKLSLISSETIKCHGRTVMFLKWPW